jgi:hypothetical protein
MTLWFLRELRALRGEKSFFIKCKEFTTKILINYLTFSLPDDPNQHNDLNHLNDHNYPNDPNNRNHINEPNRPKKGDR